MATETEKASARLVALSNLENAVREFIKAAEADGYDQPEVESEITDAIFNGSDKKINFDP